MANNTEHKTEKKQRTSNQWSFQKILDFCAYIAIGCIAVALVFTAIFKGNSDVSRIFNNIGQCIAYILAMILAAYWVRRKKHVAWLCCYIVFVVVIIVMYIINLL